MLVLILACSLFFCLIIRTGYLQLIKGEWLSTKASEQQTREIPIEPKRGTIYDANMKELAVSVTKYTVWCKPVEVKDKKDVAEKLASVLGKEEEEVSKLVNKKNTALVRIQRWIDDETATKIRDLSLSGIWVAEDNQRYYPYGNFAAYVLGHTAADSTGIAGIEMQYNSKLQGKAGKLIVSTDASGREIPQGSETYYEPVQGNGLVLTIDEVIQHYAEKAIEKAYEVTGAKRVNVIAMDPKTGDILAMASKPDYDPNDSRTAIYPYYQELLEEYSDKEKINGYYAMWRNPLINDTYEPGSTFKLITRTAIYPYYQELLEEYSDKEKINGYYAMWRNPLINDTYEPGSTFKLITSSASVEEGVVSDKDKFVCTGSVTVGGRKIKCWRHYRPHGEQTFAQGVQNSCNIDLMVSKLLLKEFKIHVTQSLLNYQID